MLLPMVSALTLIGLLKVALDVRYRFARAVLRGSPRWTDALAAPGYLALALLLVLVFAIDLSA
jgi:hypothetical protein